MINIYLISCTDVNGDKLHKIGITRRKIEKRMKEFKTGNASELHLVNSFKSKWAFQIEASLKRRFKKYNISGEWFDLSTDDISNFENYCLNLHENFELISTENTWYIDKNQSK